MILRRLSWAGVEWREAGWRILVDALEDTLPFRHFAGRPLGPLQRIHIDDSTAALVTHVHRDHCDLQLLSRVPAGQVFCHAPVAPGLREGGLEPTSLALWESTEIGPFKITPVPGQDWRSDDQVAWIIEAGDLRVIHCGDTMWHGQWYAIARRYAPFDVAFLPINGFIARLDGFTATDVPGSLTPEQAIEAAVVLEAKTACAIHHSLFDNPPLYTQQPKAIERFLAAGRRRGINAIVPNDGDAVVSTLA